MVTNINEKREYDTDLNDYSPFIINKSISLHLDTIFYANEMNLNAGLSDRMQYDYLYFSIPKKKRYTKWLNKSKKGIADLEAIKEYYKYNTTKAKQALKILSEEQIEKIKEKLIKGGIDDRNIKNPD